MTVEAPDTLNASNLIVDGQEVNLTLLEQMLREADYTWVASTVGHPTYIEVAHHIAM